MRIRIFGLLVLLAACAETAEITQPPVVVTPTNRADASGLDVYAGPRARGATVPAFRGQTTFPVRTMEGQSGFDEVTGANCALDSGVFTAQFQSPATVVVPNYGSQSPTIVVQCELGNLKGSANAPLYNITAARRSNAAAGLGIVGMIAAEAINAAAADPENDLYGYNTTRVRLQ